MMHGCTSCIAESLGGLWELGRRSPPPPPKSTKGIDSRILLSIPLVHSKFLLLEVNFLLSKYLFPGCSSFLSVDYAFASRTGAPLNLVVCQLTPQTGTGTGTYFVWYLEVLRINFKTFNVLSNFNWLFWYFKNRGTVLNLVPHLCVCVQTSLWHTSMIVRGCIHIYTEVQQYTRSYTACSQLYSRRYL